MDGGIWCREGGLLVQRFTQKGAPYQSQTLSGLFILLRGDTNQWNKNTVRSYGCGSESTRWWKTSGGDGDVTSQWCKLDLVVENCRKIIWKWLDNILPSFALLQIQFVNVLCAFFLYVSNSFLACKRMLAGGTWHKKVSRLHPYATTRQLQLKPKGRLSFGQGINNPEDLCEWNRSRLRARKISFKTAIVYFPCSSKKKPKAGGFDPLFSEWRNWGGGGGPSAWDWLWARAQESEISSPIRPGLQRIRAKLRDFSPTFIRISRASVTPAAGSGRPAPPHASP